MTAGEGGLIVAPPPEAEAVVGAWTVRPGAPAPRRSWALRGSALFAVALVVASWLFVFADGGGFGELFSAETVANGREFLRRLAGVGEDPPAYLDAVRWREAAILAIQTLAMSVLAIGLAAVGTLMTVMSGTRPIDGERGPVGAFLYGAIRFLWIVARAVPELVWALLIVFVLRPGILAGAAALGLHNFGVLAKLCAETVENLDRRPIRAVRAAGASRAQTLFYAVLPSALPNFLTFLLYRWEVIVRTTVVVGVVAAAGLGRELRLRMSFFHYSDVALLLLAYFVLVLGVDAIGAGLRRLAR